MPEPSSIFDLLSEFTKPSLSDFYVCSPNDSVPFDEMYQLRPEYQKRVLKKEIDRLKRNIQSLTDTLSDQSETLKQKEDELKKL
jgi:hypothetical protein